MIIYYSAELYRYSLWFPKIFNLESLLEMPKEENNLGDEQYLQPESCDESLSNEGYDKIPF